MHWIAPAIAAFFFLVHASPAQTSGSSTASSVRPLTAERGVAWCKDASGNRLPNRTVTLSNGYRPYTGGHNHDVGTRPTSAYGSLSSRGGTYSGYSGYSFTFTASRVGQTEWIKACCGQNCKTGNIQVRYPDLSVYSGHSTNVFIGQTSTHRNNHYGTALLKNAISRITRQYRDEFDCYDEYEPVGVNDMALEFGGVFDLYPWEGEAKQWTPGHKAHDRGKAVDFRCKAKKYRQRNSIIYDAEIINRFQEICARHGLRFTIREKEGTSNEHIHCATNRGGT